MAEKTIDQLEPVSIPEDLDTVRVPVNIGGQTVRITAGDLKNAIAALFADNDLSNLTSTGLKRFNKNHITGGVASSNRTTNNHSINLTACIALCKDLSTIINIEAKTNYDLVNTENTNITSLVANTTYHVMGFHKNDNTDKLWLDTTLTPTFIPSGGTEAIINSTNAYRRIFSFKTDSSGDIREFYAYDELGSIRYEYISEILDVNLTTTNIPTTPTDLTLSVPSGLKLKVSLKGFVNVGNSATRNLYIKDKNNNRIQLVSNLSLNSQQVYYNDNTIYTNTSGQIQYYVDVADSNTQEISIYTMYFTDYRIND